MDSRVVTIDEQGMLHVFANIFPLLSALWLADDSATVSFRYVLTHDQMMCFGDCFQLVLLLFILLSVLFSYG